MKLRARQLSAIGEGEYEILFDTGAGSIVRARCHVSNPTCEPQVRFDVGAQTAAISSPEMLRAVLSFHHARTSRYDPPQPPVRNVPPWFDPTPLKLSEIEAVSDVEYELRLAEPDGEVKTIRKRVVIMSRGNDSFLVVNTIGDPKLSTRIYPRDINSATADFHVAVHSEQ